MAKTSAERSREWRERQKSKAAGAKVAQPKKARKRKAPAEDAEVEARREATRQRYAALKKDRAAYEAMLVKARERAAAYHERRRAQRKAEARAARKGSK